MRAYRRWRAGEIDWAPTLADFEMMEREDK